MPSFAMVAKLVASYTVASSLAGYTVKVSSSCLEEGKYKMISHDWRIAKRS